MWQGIGCDGCVAARGWVFGVMEYFRIFVSCVQDICFTLSLIFVTHIAVS